MTNLNTGKMVKNSAKVLLASLGLAVAVMAPGYAYAHSHTDHDRAREAFANGEILSLQEVLAKVNQEHTGKVIEVELDYDHGMYEYEIKILRDDGALVKVKADASNGNILKVKERKK